jgi:hypothetical protein
MPSLDAAEEARAFAAQALHQPADSIRIPEVQPLADGHRVLLETQIGSYEAEVRPAGVVRLKPA